MPWSKQYSQLRDAMATQIPFREDALPILTEADINWKSILLTQNPTTLWHNILSFTESNAKTNDLISVLILHFPGNPHLLSFRENLDYSLGPEVKDLEWKKEIETEALEKITGAVSTFLPIHFLQMGLKMARSVARILIEKPSGKEAGSGFLLSNNLFLTNHHVIPDPAIANMAIIQFDYEESIGGLAVPVTEFKLDPDKGFGTSVENDWTVIRIKGDANTQFGAIELIPVSTSQKDFVNIIQHPGGMHKKIGLYHNIVTYSDNKIIQYLTDTEAGSSGSPVFNSQWEVVALHHSGGMLREPGTTQTLMRNEGININVVIDGIKATKL